MLKQPKLIGRGGGARGGRRKRRSWDYNVMCDLCGFKVRRNALRRGYVRSHVTGINYLPEAAAPENWTYPVRDPDWFDANTINWFSYDETDPAFVFPQIEKDSDYRTPPGHYRYPGCPRFTVTTANQPAVQFGVPSAAWAVSGGYLIVWVYILDATNLEMYAVQTGPPLVVLLGNTDLSSLGANAWHKLIYETTWDTSDNVGIAFENSVAVTGNPTIVFGGAQLTSGDPEIACLPHRSSGLGAYTTGGMMELCPDCYSGLRRRVPWE
jgi:hypothetical protein